MNISQYLEILNNKYQSGISLEHSCLADLENWEHVGITNMIADDSRVSNRSKEKGCILPLYLYPEKSGQQTTNPEQKRTPNLDPKILKQIEKNLGLEFLAEEPGEGEVCFSENKELRVEYKTYFTPLNLLDYIYAVLHSPTYRETYKEFLKIDFPRVPYPEDQEKFWQLVKLGGKLRSIHLLESPLIEDFITTYPVGGDNVISRKITKTSLGFEPKQEMLKQVQHDENKETTENSRNQRHSSTSLGMTAKGGFGKVWINDEQYFDNVPEVAWEFYIGGYQPAQKWLKDRKGRKLSFEDILHYQKIIVALTETDRLMKEIDKIEIVNTEE